MGATQHRTLYVLCFLFADAKIIIIAGKAQQKFRNININ